MQGTWLQADGYSRSEVRKHRLSGRHLCRMGRSHSSHIASHLIGLRVSFCAFFALKANPGYSYALTKLSHLVEKWGGETGSAQWGT